MIFAGELHIRPWEIGDLTVTQFHQAIGSFEEQQRERDARR